MAAYHYAVHVSGGYFHDRIKAAAVDLLFYPDVLCIGSAIVLNKHLS